MSDQEQDLAPGQDPTSSSPLAQANPNALAELFSRDPLNLSDRDIDAMVALLREQRHQWAEQEVVKQNKEKKPRAKASATPSGDLSAVLATLGIA